MSDIRDERTRQAISQKRLAQSAGIDPRTLRKIEKGETVSLESLRSVRQALGISATRPVASPPVPTDAWEQVVEKRASIWRSHEIYFAIFVWTLLALFIWMAVYSALLAPNSEIRISGPVASERVLAEMRVDLERVGMRRMSVEPVEASGAGVVYAFRGRLDRDAYPSVAGIPSLDRYVVNVTPYPR